MTKEIRYSVSAYISLNKILRYVKEGFGELKMNELDEEIERIVELISLNPRMGRLTRNRSNIRRFVIKKITSVYYRVRKDHIEIVLFRDNRMNPKTLKF